MKVKVPSLSYVEVETDEFSRTCVKKFCPDTKPKFGIHDVVMMEADFGRRLPAVVIGLEPRVCGWFYHVARPRWVDGSVKRVGVSEDKLSRVS